MTARISDREGFIRGCGASHGFDAVRIASASHDFGAELSAFIADGRHASMTWMPEKAHWRRSPQALWPEARSVILVAMNYGPAEDPRPGWAERSNGVISVYARNRDYHDVLKGKLKLLAGNLVKALGGEVKVFVDTAPVMEKPLAAAAGIGWAGKHTNLVSRDFGSWLFLGAIYTTLDLAPDAPVEDSCGSCTACLDACPTGALDGVRQIDARKCISYLTIEHAGPVEESLRPQLGNRIYGCDDCLAACPWNKFAQVSAEAKFHARAELVSPSLADLVALDDAGFRTLFSGSPIKRIGRDRFVRNVLYAIGNSNDSALLESAKALLEDPSDVVGDAARWALTRLP